MESYSRVLESLAFNIVARIDDLLYVDDLAKHSDSFPSISGVGLIAQKSITIPYSVNISGTPYRTTFKTPSFSPAHLHSPVNKGEKSPLAPTVRLHHRGFDVRKVFTDIIRTDTRGKEGRKPSELDSISDVSMEASASPLGQESFECRRDGITSLAKDLHAKG